MSENKFTAGPWTRRGKSIGTIVDDDTQAFGMMLVIAHIDEYDHPEHDANARLIAAAPELLEALRMAANSGGFQYMTHETRDAIETALAKARGES